MKTAAVLFVRNDVNGIVHWIAWHLLKGFSDIIVFDDFSDDGTWEKLKSLSKRGNIHIFRSERTESNFQIRQGWAYERAIREFHSFDWLAFLDSDEYLQLLPGLTLPKFLARFDLADAVAVNWCVYGSSGHVGRPLVPTPQAYLHHSVEQWPPNKHVKTLLRPASIVGNYINQHCFPVADSRYLSASAGIIEWSESLGIIKGEVDWSIAKVMHYQCKSMQDFVERVSLRSDVSYSVANFYALDRNEIRDDAPVSEVRDYHSLVRDLESSNEVSISAEKTCEMLSAARASESHKPQGVFNIQSFFGRGIRVFDGEVQELTNEADLSGFLLVFPTQSHECAVLAPSNLDSYAGSDREILSSLIWPVFTTYVDGGVAIQALPDGDYLRAMPQGGALEFDAAQIGKWETFILKPFGGRVN